MWLATEKLPPSVGPEPFFELSPRVNQTAHGFILIDLVPVLSYWQLRGGLPAMERTIARIFKHHHQEAVYALAEHASLALFQLQKIDPEQEDSIQQITQVLGDLVSLRPSFQSEIALFLENARSLGLSKLSDLKRIKTQELSSRLGLAALECCKRMAGSSPLAMTPVQVHRSLQTVFFPELDRAMQSDLEKEHGVYGRVLDVLQLWNKTLEHQALVLRGLSFQVELEIAGRGKVQHAFDLYFPRATRDLESIQKILFEKWQFESEKITRVEIKTLGFDPEPQNQLSLFSSSDGGFDLEQEEVGVFMGQLLARSTASAPIDFGFFKPVRSYLPEKSLKWESFIQQSPPPSAQNEKTTLEYTPPRPQFLLKKAKKIKKIKKEDQFFRWVSENGGNLRGLEAIEGRWYARVLYQDRNAWVFWSEEQGDLMIHGYFES